MKRIHLAVHDVSPVHWKVLGRMVSTLKDLGVHRYSMLVVPDYHGEWPLDAHADFCSWLRELAGEGVEMVLHGFRHQRPDAPKGPADRARAAMFTRGEGEFLGLSRARAEKLILEGRSKLKVALGMETECFAAPAWLYSGGTMKALTDLGFTAAESRWRIWNPTTGKTLLRVPVANYAGGGPLRRVPAASWVGLYSGLFRGAGTIRFAIHPHDFSSAALSDRAAARTGRLLAGRQPVTLVDLAAAP